MVLVPGGGYDYQLSTDDNNELFSKRKTCFTGKTLVFVNLMTNNCLFLGRVSPLHRSTAASRQDLRLHLVQPSSSEAEIFQETREEDESGGGKAMQRGADGKNLV